MLHKAVNALDAAGNETIYMNFEDVDYYVNLLINQIISTCSQTFRSCAVIERLMYGSLSFHNKIQWQTTFSINLQISDSQITFHGEPKFCNDKQTKI
jgi:hypothetical protein